MDLTKAILPSSIEVGGSFYGIHTGHSYWFRFSQIIGSGKVFLTDLDFMYLDEVPDDRQAGIDALSSFYYEKKELPRSTDDDGERVLDYDIDSDLLYAAILQCYGIDLYEKQHHWHKVRAMISGLHGTKLNDIIGLRCADGKNKELTKAKRAWALPEKISEEKKQVLDAFNAQFYNA